MKLSKVSVGLVVTTAALSGCGMNDEDAADEFRTGVPRAQSVEVKVPGAGQAAVHDAPLEATSQALTVRGQTAELYQLTRKATSVVNGGALVTLALVKIIVSYPPTVVRADSAVWGPWTGALEPVTWRLTVNRVGAHQYAYSLDGRGRGDATGAFVTVLSGTHSPTVDAQGRPQEGFGEGTFLLDWDARRTLPLPDDNVGKAQYRYARPDAAAGAEVDAQFTQVKDDERPGQRVDLAYQFRSTAGAGGNMEFVHTAPMSSGKAGSRLAVKSRWTGAGLGRSDVRATGGDLPAGTTAQWNECWNGLFASTYQQVSWDPGKNYGAESTDCAFTSAEYSSL
jgi:hypothetical protein